MLKTRFPFICASTSLDTNRNFESCLSIRCLAPVFLFFPRVFSFAFGNFAHYDCVVLLSTPLSYRDKQKKRVCIGLFLPRNLDPSSLTLGVPVVPSVCSFRRRDNLLAWRVFFANLHELKSRIWLWEEYNNFERIERLYRFNQFSSKFAKIFQEEWQMKVCREFWYLNYLSRGVHLRNTPRIFLATSNLDADIYTTNQNIEKAWHTFLIDALWTRLCSHFAHAEASDTPWLQ